MKYLSIFVVLLLVSCGFKKETAEIGFKKFMTSFLNDFYKLNPDYASYFGSERV